MIEHDFLPDPFGRDVCDRKIDEHGRGATCSRPRLEHVPTDPLQALADARAAWDRRSQRVKSRHNPRHFSEAADGGE